MSNVDPAKARPLPVRRSGVVIPQQPRWHGKLAAGLIFSAIRLMSWTWRMNVEEVHAFAASVKEPVILAVWHNRLASVGGFWPAIKRGRPELKLAALVSASRDGGLLARVLEHLRIQPIRGSSSRRGSQALRESVTLMEHGYNLAITPDGPRGPKYQVQPGIVSLAQLTGRPIFATGIRIAPKTQLRSWDAFQVPFPFSTCELTFSEPFFVAREATEEEREAARINLEAKMLEMNSCWDA